MLISGFFGFFTQRSTPSPVKSAPTPSKSLATDLVIKEIISSLNDRPLTDAESEQVRDLLVVSVIRNNGIDLTKYFPPDKIDEARRHFEEVALQYESRIAERERQSKEALAEIARLEAETALEEEKIKIGFQKIADCDEKIARADEKIARASEKIANSEERLLEIRKRRPIILAGSFYGIFKNGPLKAPPLSDEAARAIFDRYLANGDFTTEENHERRPFSQINSMRAVKDYFVDNQALGINTLDFRPFKNINNSLIQQLADFLSTPEAQSIKQVVFKKGTISTEAEAILAELELSRAGDYRLKTIYK